MPRRNYVADSPTGSKPDKSEFVGLFTGELKNETHNPTICCSVRNLDDRAGDRRDERAKE
jgi:hypothetical protein